MFVPQANYLHDNARNVVVSKQIDSQHDLVPPYIGYSDDYQ